MATKSTVPWDWDLLTSVISSEVLHSKQQNVSIYSMCNKAAQIPINVLSKSIFQRTLAVIFVK